MNRIALVTGGSRGIGRGIAERLAADGVVVGVHYGSNETAAKETVAAIEAAGGRAFTVGARLGVPGDVDALFAAFTEGVKPYADEPHLDILVNNAGTNGPGSVDTATPEGYDAVMDLNLKAPFFTVQKALPLLRDGGRIINISSGASHATWKNDPAYAMTKAALDSFTRSLAAQLGPRDITVNSVGPGVIDTDMNASWLRDSPEGREAGAAWSVFKRVGEVDDVAEVVGFIASDKARWVTGQFIDATGGSLLIGA
ncbi:SDR family oxidoreductase [Stackebrandtia nassauensis]|uniref:Short-chain dehydrogenase/reductase SDR n=1 Tax=Stackebrandtia nassauensis (strain DSM 44728 / CIP 108903 / NRRL B-16338 / NBRC 102104 / LLR-40K-21) TaxID=446470 RepID=D3PWU8_STANL|nr:SDR family oxidoreductase [Stackebrandtia nassauensis]ADD45172.1 short-chain dehydrogenase/reductase SDR [Stackebrandtia nassauensis DSM 44728]